MFLGITTQAYKGHTAIPEGAEARERSGVKSIMNQTLREVGQGHLIKSWIRSPDKYVDHLSP